MSNLEKHPAEVLLADVPASEPTGRLGAGVAAQTGLEILEPRDVPLGGPRAMSVRRTLPQRARSLIGAWCFLDHYGPDDISRHAGMDVPPHPHTGLQTVSWLFAGEIEHRDSAGHHAVIRPGELNLMTAGSGIQHSERSIPGGPVMLHGAQLWIALPEGARHTAPGFERFVASPVSVGGSGGAAVVQVFLGELAGQRSTATTYTSVVAAQLDVPAGVSVELAVDPGFEHGVLVDTGDAVVDGSPVPVAHLAYLPVGASSIRISAGATAVRALLIGGEPFGEQIVMWWNFVGRSHDEVVAFREQWQREAVGGADPAGRFGAIPEDPEPPLPAPELPNVRLRPRG